ncbi:iron-containing alcohol dehydrogenase [Streptomyces niveiscabiei]|uniref:Iron-containing alcohol dehydrogenase n=1 Tax=Streptomyces niveiscabiei TaxID=164115 RepID=A0ABW9HKG9_9ACTN
MHFDLDIPTRIVFGAGTLDRLGALTGELGGRPLLVTGRSAGRKYGYLERALSSLGGAVHFDGVSPNPTCAEVEQAAEVARRHGCDVVVGLGGGSPLDAAKAVAAVLGTGRPATSLLGATLAPDDPVVPIVAVPTTAGSGSEVTKGAIVTDTVRRFRSGIRGDALTPRIAVIDPELTATVPPHVRTETAFDAFAHAVEGFVARRSDPLSQALAVQALGLITEHTDALVRGDDSRAGREALSLAALLGGINVARASTCLPHRLQQAMGALPDLGISHGRGLAVVYPAWLRHTEHHAPDDFGRLAQALGTSSVGEAVGAFLERTSLASRLRDHGVSRTDLGALLDGVSGNLDNDPRPDVDAEYLRVLYEESY